MIKYYDTEDEAISNALKDYGWQDDFSGKNCEDFGSVCAGWDGESRRCECGNRRVYWCPEQNSDGKWYVFAEAW